MSMKYSDAFMVGMGVTGFPLGIMAWLAVHFGGAYVAFAGYEDESGSVFAGFMWLFLWGPLLMMPTGVAVAVVAAILGAVSAPFIMAVAAALRLGSRVRLAP